MAANNYHRPVLIVIAGPNGSGKTSVTSKIENDKGTDVIPMDLNIQIIMRLQNIDY